MKFRTGFVSNSSSSSYMILLKKPFDKDFYEARERIMEFFRVDPESPFWGIAKEMADILLGGLDHVGSIEEAEESEGWVPTKIKEYLEDRDDVKEFKHVYVGRLSTGDGGIEEFIMNYITVDIDGDDMIMYFDGMF